MVQRQEWIWLHKQERHERGRVCPPGTVLFFTFHLQIRAHSLNPSSITQEDARVISVLDHDTSESHLLFKRPLTPF